jgi:hypothetical protein
MGMQFTSSGYVWFSHVEDMVLRFGLGWNGWSVEVVAEAERGFG